MNVTRKLTLALAFCCLLFTGPALAASGHDMAGHAGDTSDRIGKLFHESMQEGYMLSYYLMDLREQKGEKAAEHGSEGGHGSHGSGSDMKDMEKPHHIMVYIMDKDHKMVEKAKVGFLIKGGDKGTQKAMGMYMSKGFGITADMKAKGTYSIVTKAVVGDIKIMDKFDYEMK